MEINRWSMTLMPSAAALPQRVDHGLQILLVDDQVVGLRLGITGKLGGGVRRRVVEGDRDRLNP
ncbi:hypothetical protein GCM10023238_19990 [Streptomyces heliomycini]